MVQNATPDKPAYTDLPESEVHKAIDAYLEKQKRTKRRKKGSQPQTKQIETIALGPNAIAEALDISRTAVFWLFRENHLPSFKIGKRRLARVEAVEDLARRLEADEIKINMTQDRRSA